MLRFGAAAAGDTAGAAKSRTAAIRAWTALQLSRTCGVVPEAGFQFNRRSVVTERNRLDGRVADLSLAMSEGQGLRRAERKSQERDYRVPLPEKSGSQRHAEILSDSARGTLMSTSAFMAGWTRKPDSAGSRIRSRRAGRKKPNTDVISHWSSLNLSSRLSSIRA